MTRRSWKNRQPTSLRQAMEWCLEYARERHNRSVDRVAELMGLASRWTLYKWLESGRLPAILIRPFEEACGITYVTRFIGHSAHKLLIDIPTGRNATAKDINGLQASCTEVVGKLLAFYEGKVGTEETLATLHTTMEQLAYQQRTVEKHQQPELGFGGKK
ncbi:hypothetical protein [Sedimenticola selenatireducens]|uniref:hypothetical protein n=1 Tax=Sedimenticola selenatireducens TaxID=191960 RepID=UPI00048A7BF7|nr:hypothetical protein [Sedimenticola selenatireducens]